ncbi:MAG: ABC transporter ATP-binding protein [Myxococcota bacterium]
MIEVQNLTKRYGTFEAIREVSFSVARGEVVGFLGPNGAGKSTTMRILCGCIGATAGRATIDGQSVLEHPRAVKRKIGYLPETPPLYGAMAVDDYLRFAARIKDVDDPAAATDTVIARVGLQEVSHRIIDHLSKGYRQRVGLAQALVHDPDVLVLDEPTSGLDPAQRREIRDLLAELAAGERTVILSSHVLGEIESICERVVIINRGRIIAQDRIDALRATSNRVRLHVARPAPALHDALLALADVSAVTRPEPGHYEITATGDVREHLAHVAVEYGLLALGQAEQLEDVYLRLTQETAEPSGDAS